MSETFSPNRFSRRRFLANTGTIALAAALPRSLLAAAPVPKAARYHRLSLADPKAKPALESYKKAIKAMLALPPTDPRNWYRNAFIHLFDCPHGNWWFLVWHRGYLGWFEKTCRQLSGNPNFALPYWDWTAEPRLPASFFDLVPPVVDFGEFKEKFCAPMTSFWKSLSPAQAKQVERRGYDSVEEFFNKLSGLFTMHGQVRKLTSDKPDFDSMTRTAVSPSVIHAALAPRNFLEFGGLKAGYHSMVKEYGILEDEPHDNVHGNVAGYMTDFRSPIDPLFFVHHANIDRWWDVWTRKQQALGLMALPTGADLGTWSSEEFNFFINAQGKPVSKKAGDSVLMSQFDYDYQPGSGEAIVQERPTELAISMSGKTFPAAIESAAFAFSQRAASVVKVPPDLIQAASTDTGPTLFARITIQPPADPQNVLLDVFVNAPGGAADIEPESPHFAGSFVFFGCHHPFEGPFTFTMPLSPALKTMRSANRLKADEPLKIQVVPKAKGPAPAAQELTGSLQKVVVGTF
ncbi:MAG TPA: tyrosinase family protein [Thermoanaerobaculia bacterium]|nr:tyrosinase family protein [Thermoanaerobaculia bacterium]